MVTQSAKLVNPVLKKEKEIELKGIIDDMRMQIVKYFDILQETVEEFQSDVLADQRSDSHQLTAKFQKLLDKKGQEIGSLNLFKVTGSLDQVMGVVDQRIEAEVHRLNKSNEPSQNYNVWHNSGVHTGDADARQKRNSMLYRGIEQARNHQIYKEPRKLLYFIFRKKQRGISVLKGYQEQAKITEFLQSENARQVNKFYQDRQGKQVEFPDHSHYFYPPLKNQDHHRKLFIEGPDELLAQFFTEFLESVPLKLKENYDQQGVQILPTVTKMSAYVSYVRHSSDINYGIYGKVIELEYSNEDGQSNDILFSITNSNRNELNEAPFKTHIFAVCSTQENYNITPEGESKFQVFRYVTYQLKKLYQFYESLSDFPVGILLMQFTMYKDLHEEHCQSPYLQKKCPNKLLWDPYYGLLPPLYREVWLRYSTIWMYHNACYTIQRSFQQV